jgi:hypothetical protein
MITEAEWLGSLTSDPLRGRDTDEARRCFNALLEFEQLDRIAASLSNLPRIANHEQYAKYLSKQVNRLSGLHSPALDRLFEMEVAARLACQPELTVAFEEPDVVACFPSALPFVVACKRPRSLKSVAANIRGAKHQIRRCGKPGVIVIGMEVIFHRTDTDSTAVRIPRGTDAEGVRLIEEAIKAAQHEVLRLLTETLVYGVVYFGVLAYIRSGRDGFRKSILGREQINVSIANWEVVPMINQMLVWTPGKEWAGGNDPIQPVSLKERAALMTLESMKVLRRLLEAGPERTRS